MAKRISLSTLLLGLVFAAPCAAQQPFEADVVVLSDTSKSMSTNDPQNAVVLVTRLLSDLVPGKLAAVRLVDLGQDEQRLPTRKTGGSKPCPDNPGQTCYIVDMLPGAEEKAVNDRMLAVIRASRGDSSFKTRVQNLFAASANDTVYRIAFLTIQSIFRQNASPASTPKVVVWLSDGDADDWPGSKPVLSDLLANGVLVKPVVFKSGKTEVLRGLGLEPNLVDGSPRELMAAFANAFRAIVQAPYRIDGRVADTPSFAIKPRMEEAWVIVYGDDSLADASVSGQGQTVPANYAADRYNHAAYRVAHLVNPAPGNWSLSVNGGGPNVSYAVVQRSTIGPHIEVPQTAPAGIPFKLQVTLRTARGEDLTPADLPEPVTLEADVEGQKITLHDDGANGDDKAGDGHYSALVTPQRTGTLPIAVRAHSTYLDRSAKASVDVRGFFRYSGGPVLIDFGSLRAGQTICRPLRFNAEQQGAAPFELREIKRLPSDVQLELPGAGKRRGVGGEPLPLLPDEQKELCLVTGKAARASQSHEEEWADLGVSGRSERESIVPLRKSWSIRELSFWEKWGWLILLILLGLLIGFIIYGYIKPHRFPPGLALCFAPEMDELDDQTPQPVRLWRGVGIGFYRDARACLQDNFRVTGKVKGAIAILQAGPRRAVFVKPGQRALYREVGPREWELVPPTGRRAGQGEIYRAGESGPYFRLSMRGIS